MDDPLAEPVALELAVVVGIATTPVPTVDIDEPSGGKGCKPIVGSVGAPMFGVVEVPIVGSVGVPIPVAPGVPMVGSVGVPMVGSVGVPIVGPPIVGTPIVALVGMPIVGSVGIPKVGDVPIVGDVEAPVPNIGERELRPGVMAVWLDGNMDAGVDIAGPKFIRLDGSISTDCA